MAPWRPLHGGDLRQVRQAWVELRRLDADSSGVFGPSLPTCSTSPLRFRPTRKTKLGRGTAAPGLSRSCARGRAWETLELAESHPCHGLWRRLALEEKAQLYNEQKTELEALRGPNLVHCRR